MSCDYSDSWGRDLLAKVYADWGKRHLNTPPKKKKIYGSRKAIRAVLKARKEKEQSK